MMRQWKLACRMLKYSYGIKMNMIAMILIGVCGVVFGFGNSEPYLREMGLFFLALSPMFAVQMWYSMNSCELLRSSAWKKAADTSIPVLLALVGMLLVYTLAVVATAVRGGMGDLVQMSSLLWMAVSGFLILLLCGATYKYFIASMVVFFVFYFSGYFATIFLLFSAWELPLPAPAVIALGYVLIFAGALGQYLLATLFYKKNVSRLAQGASLRKYL